MSKPEKIVITGPESTGKTTLATELASHFGTPVVPEHARYYIDNLNRRYRQEDLIHIARGQIELEEQAFQKAKDFFFCDTDLLTIKIWMEDKFHQKHEWLINQLQVRKPDLYLLCDIDLPWEYDPQREDVERREYLLEVYKRELSALNIQWEIIKGKGKMRTHQAIRLVEKTRKTI